jgi:hypothetical protein
MKNHVAQSNFGKCLKLSVALLLGLMLCAGYAGIGFAQNNTIFGPNVYVFSPGSDTATQTTLNTTAVGAIGQFGTGRIAVLFMPGTYNLQAKMGFYESINGLGENPSGVTINGYLTPNYSGSATGNVTTTFWRSMENLTINAATNTGQNASANRTTFNPATTAPVNTLQWGVSQGTSLRRLQINGGLEVNDTGCGEASGGYIADTAVTGAVYTCTQQQWYTRNSSVGSWTPVTTPLLGDGPWNITFSGVLGAPPASWPLSGSAYSCGGLCSYSAYATLPTTPVVREKPFLYVDSGGNYNVFVPTLLTNSSGTSWSGGGLGTGYSLPVTSGGLSTGTTPGGLPTYSTGTFFIATPTSTLAAINAALASGQNLILTPGIYTYSGSINVTNANTIVLGMGYADLIPQTGTAAITVADVDGVQIAGLLIDAGPVNSPVLLQVGNPGGTPRVSHAANPTSISDAHVRIGGYLAGTATTSFEIDSDNVILDNNWLWRADHGTGAGWTSNPAAHGLVVNGDNVTALGLFVEHYQQNQVVWNGNGGETIFYQSEFPYDPPNQAGWMDGSIDGYASYYVSPLVTTHNAYGLGVYSNFNNPVVAQSGITVPVAVGVTVTDAVTVFLANKGSITYTVNDAGDQVLGGTIDLYHGNSDGDRSYVSFYGGSSGSCTAAPSVPGTPSWIGTSTTSISLTWGASTAGSSCTMSYSVFRSTTPGFTPSSSNLIAESLTTASYADTGLTPATTYYYVIEAVDGAGTSAASAQVTIVPALPDFSISITPASLAISGILGMTTVTVTPAGDFSSAVTFACSGLPVGAACNFSSATLTPSGNVPVSTQLWVGLSTPVSAVHGNSNPLLPGGATLAFALCLFGFRKRRNLQLLLLLMVSVIGLSLFTGCNNSNFLPTRQPSTSTVTVTGTAGSLQRTATFTLIVQ